MLDWLTTNYLEVFGVISGLLFLYFEYKENALLWPLGLATSAIYIVVFYQSKFYADMGLSVYYVIVSGYGWYIWQKGSKVGAPMVQIRRGSKVLLSKIVMISLVLWLALYFLLSKYTDSPVPVGDAFTSAFSITATWMLSRKIIEQWWFWVVINVVAASLYAYRGLYPTVLLYTIYALISVAGYFEWNRKLTNKQFIEPEIIS